MTLDDFRKAHEEMHAKKDADVCPSCGHCKHCGRGWHQVYPWGVIPYPYPIYPQPHWWYSPAYEVTSGTTTGLGNAARTYTIGG